MPRICFLLLRSRSIHREPQSLSRGHHWIRGDSCSGSCAAAVQATCANWLATGGEGQTDGIPWPAAMSLIICSKASPERSKLLHWCPRVNPGCTARRASLCTLLVDFDWFWCGSGRAFILPPKMPSSPLSFSSHANRKSGLKNDRMASCVGPLSVCPQVRRATGW